ncbi:MAG: type II toxin-antitoxin system VapC family toxin [Armatimonadota bacterium]|nr:type II toxin-antitoxin system VapC family toxin [Armatimonadota bacterium]
MRCYAESSAVLAWLLGEDAGEDVRQLLIGAEDVFTSVLTLVETDRTLIRAQVVDNLTPVAVADRRRVLARASRRWHLVNVVEEILDRARRPFPGEPIRTLDALHLASALAVRAAIPELTVLSLDQRIRNACVELGFDVLPGAHG